MKMFAIAAKRISRRISLFRQAIITRASGVATIRGQYKVRMLAASPEAIPARAPNRRVHLECLNTAIEKTMLIDKNEMERISVVWLLIAPAWRDGVKNTQNIPTSNLVNLPNRGSVNSKIKNQARKNKMTPKAYKRKSHKPGLFVIRYSNANKMEYPGGKRVRGMLMVLLMSIGFAIGMVKPRPFTKENISETWFDSSGSITLFE